MRFKAVILMTKDDRTPDDRVLAEIRKFEGWDKQNPFTNPQKESAFLKDPAQAYEAAERLARLRMHRRLYRMIRLPQLMKKEQQDGSNGLDLSAEILKELPEEAAEALRVKQGYVTFRLSSVDELNRRQLEDLVELLDQVNRQNDKSQVVNRWLSAQEKRLNNGQLDGTIATAEQYYFAFERWKIAEHQKRGDDLYKQAYVELRETAPKEAERIYERLQAGGWEWLSNKWMTSNEVKNLPKDDIELAMRERRVVKGMTTEQVKQVFGGEPDRKLRFVSSQQVQAIWIYGGGGSSTVIHLTRKRFDSPQKAIVTFVGQEAF